MITIVTHSGSFHADDVLAVATLRLHLGEQTHQIIRTRDEAIIQKADWVVDVGGVYDPVTKRFDHHQIGAPIRDNGIPFAAFGLVWRELGEQLCDCADVAAAIDRELVQPVDAGDTGVTLYTLNEHTVAPFELFQVIGSYAPSWGSDASRDKAFEEVVTWAEEFLRRVILRHKGKVAMEALVAATLKDSTNPRVLCFDVPVSALAAIPYPKVEVVVCPDDPESNENWTATAVRKELSSFVNRVSFPESWRGLRGEELAAVSGISDAIFCHKTGFMFVAGSKESALKATEHAL